MTWGMERESTTYSLIDRYDAKQPPVLLTTGFAGLASDLLRASEMQAETSAAAHLVQTLALFGAHVGQRAWVEVGCTRHYPCLFVGVVRHKGLGRTDGAERKGPMRIYREAIRRVPDVGQIAIPDGMDLRQIMRNVSSASWDGCESAKRYDALLFEATPEEFGRALRWKGWRDVMARRILWMWSSESGCDKSARPLCPGIRAAIGAAWAEAITALDRPVEVEIDWSARDMWHDIYCELNGGYGIWDEVEMAAYGPPLILRLALVLALFERSQSIREEHLAAATSIWRYSYDSYQHAHQGGSSP